MPRLARPTLRLNWSPWTDAEVVSRLCPERDSAGLKREGGAGELDLMLMAGRR